MAREVARQPQIILFDEPITNVDATAKLQLKRAFKELTRRLSQTIVYVTHDQTEAMTLADDIALMRDGQIVQCAPPRELYTHPADVFAGWFLGNPGMVFFDGTLTTRGDHGHLEAPLFPDHVAVQDVASGAPPEVTVGIRPERIRVGREATPGAVPGRILRTSITIGRQYLLTLTTTGLGERTFKAKVPPAAGATFAAGDDVWIDLPLDEITLFDPAGHRLAATLGSTGRRELATAATGQQERA